MCVTAYSQLLVILGGHLVARGGGAERPSGSCSHQTGGAGEAKSFHVPTRRLLLASRFARRAQWARGRWMRECWWPFLSALSSARHPEHLQHPEQGRLPAKGGPSPLGPHFLIDLRFSLTRSYSDSMPPEPAGKKVAQSRSPQRLGRRSDWCVACYELGSRR